jgi:CheY-like chemotaxis protein
MTSKKTIAMLAANPALASIFSSALEDGDHRTAVFSSLPALSTFLRIAPVDVAILNLDMPWTEMVQTVRALKAGPRSANPLLKVIVLTHAVPFVGSLAGSGIAALLVKPVTPAKLTAAVTELLGDTVPAQPATPRHIPLARRVPAPREPGAGVRQGNVIPLFGYRSTL